jgi:prefoldin subunit 5
MQVAEEVRPSASYRYQSDTENKSATMPHQWVRETHTLLDTARKFQNRSGRQRDASGAVTALTQDRVLTDSYVSNEALRQKLDDSSALKAKAEGELDVLMMEYAELEAEAARCEHVHELLKEPLAVAEECLGVRRGRPLREQTRDAVERTLNEQAAAARHGLRMLAGVMEACHKELGSLNDLRLRMEEDIEQKKVALDVDAEALNMDGGWMPQGPDQIGRSSYLPHVWKQRTDNCLADAERVRATCRRLREKSAVIQNDSLSTERQTRDAVLRALQKKIEDTSRLKSECEAACDNAAGEIGQLEEAKRRVEEAMEEKNGPLALARSRLQVRLSRPSVEQVRDEAERSLEREVSDLENSIARLDTELRRLISDMAQLEKHQIHIEADRRDKADALAVEMECEARQLELAMRLG